MRWGWFICELRDGDTCNNVVRFIYNWQWWVSGGAPGDARTAWRRGWANGCDEKMSHPGWEPSRLHLCPQVYATFLSWSGNQCLFRLENLFDQVKNQRYCLLKSSKLPPFFHYFLVSSSTNIECLLLHMLGTVLGAGEPAENTPATALAFRDQWPSSMEWSNPRRASFFNCGIIDI